MARYIDVDKLIEHLKDEIKACEPSVGSRANGRSVAYGTELGLKSAISFAETLATVDVAPKSENIIELPCKVGTTLYFLYNSPYADKPDLTPRIYKTTDWYFEVDKKGIVINTSDIHSFNKKYDYYLGETVFFTKEEAAKVIAELKKKYTEGNDERSN